MLNNLSKVTDLLSGETGISAFDVALEPELVTAYQALGGKEMRDICQARE